METMQGLPPNDYALPPRNTMPLRVLTGFIPLTFILLALSLVGASADADAWPPTPDQVPVVVVIRIDGSPEEIRWELTSLNGEVYKKVGFGTYRDPFETIVDTVYVDGDRDYFFTIIDEEGDGIGCVNQQELFCGSGTYQYEIYVGTNKTTTLDKDVRVVAGYGDFQFTRQHMFLVGSGRANDPPTPAPPSVSQPPKSVTKFPMLVVIKLTRPYMRQRVEWTVVSAQGDVYAEYPMGTYDDSAESLVEKVVYLDAGGEYVFTIAGIDDSGVEYYEVYMGTTDSTDKSARVLSLRGDYRYPKLQRQHTLYAVYPTTNAPRFDEYGMDWGRPKVNDSGMDWDSDSNGVNGAPLLFGFIGIILIFLGLFARTTRNQFRGSNESDGEDSYPRLPVGNNSLSGAQQRRKEYVMDRILTKNVLLRKVDTDDALQTAELGQNESQKAEVNTGCVRGPDELITLLDGTEATKEEHTEKKGDIFAAVRSMLSLGDSERSLDVSESSAMYSPRTCNICLENYEPGDEICWSPNHNCVHAFHTECMLDWLMKKDECPLCREDYLLVGCDAAEDEDMPDEDILDERTTDDQSELIVALQPPQSDTGVDMEAEVRTSPPTADASPQAGEVLSSCGSSDAESEGENARDDECISPSTT